jgi:asparagine synthase (glutamine-hydrolysing)
MCGIAGAIALRPDVASPPVDDMARAVGAIRHRGPDECGVFRDDRATLGHARLSIIDLATGQQPMSDASGGAWLVFNGEIFNYLELRDELEAAGHPFRTRSDTEVIIQAWRAWGEDAFARFNGQFALAIWEPRHQRLVLARDRFGVRPIYLCEHAGRLWFASEVKAIFAGDPAIPRSLDPVGLAETFTFWASVAPQGVFEGVTELEPGHLRIVEPGRTIDRAFWEPSYVVPDEFRSFASADDAAELVRASLERAVSLRMLRADVPVGSYLSGGLDSSIIASLGRIAKGDRFHTYSVRFEDAEYDETPWQRLMAERIDSEHHELLVTAGDVARAFPRVVEHAERPLLRTAPAPLFLLSEAVRTSGIKVVLTGEGADEMFAGYDLFREARVRRFWGHDPDSTIRPRLLARLYPYLERSPVGARTMATEFFGRDRERWAEPGFSHRPRWRSTAALQSMFTPAVRDAASRVDVVGRLLASLPVGYHGWGHLAQDQYLEVRTLLSSYLLSSQGDRMLMAHSVEGRFPFLDTELASLAASLPASLKLRGLDEKHVLKRVAAGLVPAEILARPKQPYRAPDAASFVTDPPDWVQELVSEGGVRAVGLFEPSAVERLWRKVRAAAERGRLSNSDDMALVGVLSTGLLHHQFVGRPLDASPPTRFDTHVDLSHPGPTHDDTTLEEGLPV